MYSSLQINCSPSRAIDYKTPIHLFHSLCKGHIHPFDFTRLKPFVCLSYAHIQNWQAKLGTKSKQVIFVGLKPGGHAARLWDKSPQRIMVSGDVQYQEDIFPAHQETTSTPVKNSLACSMFPPDLESTIDNLEPSSSPNLEPLNVEPNTALRILEDPPDIIHEDSQPDSTPVSSSILPPTPTIPQPTDGPRRSGSKTHPHQYYGFNTALTSKDHNHPTYQTAMNGPDK